MSVIAQIISPAEGVELFFHPVAYEWYLTEEELAAVEEHFSEDQSIWLFLLIYCELHWRIREEEKQLLPRNRPRGQALAIHELQEFIDGLE